MLIGLLPITSAQPIVISYLLWYTL